MALSKEEEQRFQAWLYNKMFNKPQHRSGKTMMDQAGTSEENRPATEASSSEQNRAFRCDPNRSSGEPNRRHSTGSNDESSSRLGTNNSSGSNTPNRRLSTGSNELSQSNCRSNNEPRPSVCGTPRTPNRRLSTGSNEPSQSNYRSGTNNDPPRPSCSNMPDQHNMQRSASQRNVAFKLPSDSHQSASSSFIRFTRMSARMDEMKQRQQPSKRKSQTPIDDEEEEDEDQQDLKVHQFYVPPLVRQELLSLRKSEESLRERLEHLRQSEESTMQEIREVRKVRLIMLNRIYIKPPQ